MFEEKKISNLTRIRFFFNNVFLRMYKNIKSDCISESEEIFNNKKYALFGL